MKGKLVAKGFSITNSPSSAGYIIQANLLHMGAEKEDLTADGMLAGGFGGALGGSRMGSGLTSAIAGAAGMGIVGSIAGGLDRVDDPCGYVFWSGGHSSQGGIRRNGKGRNEDRRQARFSNYIANRKGSEIKLPGIPDTYNS